MFDEDLVDSALLDDLLAPPPPLTQTAAPAVESQVTGSVPAAKPKAPRKRAKPASPRRLPPAVPIDFYSDLHCAARRKATELQAELVNGDASVQRIVITVTRTELNVNYLYEV